jgi:hypothetical protein
MRLQITTLTGVTALVISSAAFAQNSAPPPQGQPATAQPDEPGPQSTAPGQTETTPGQSQTEPGQASQMTPPDTGQTPSGKAAPEQAQANQLAKATAADVKAGTSVYDQKGDVVGKIVSATAKSAVIDTGTTKVSVPLSSFGKSDKGLVIGMTKADIDAAAKKKKPGE